MEGHKPKFYREVICSACCHMQALAQLTATVGEKLVRKIDREQKTMKEVRAIIS